MDPVFQPQALARAIDAIVRAGGSEPREARLVADNLVLANLRRHGSCVMTLANVHHLGRIGHWAEMAVAQGLISIHFANVISHARVAAHGGADARFGTNPLCIGIPLPGEAPFLLDMATSAVAQGKMRVAHNKGDKVAPGLLIDERGRPSDDPRYAVVPPLGAILPFGGHKGYGIALACELLGGALSGGGTDRKSTRLNSSHSQISYAVFCLKKR